MKKRVIAKYFLKYLFCVLPVELAGMLLLPIILPFVPKGQEQLPRFARWFDNHEIHLPGNKHSDVDGLLGPTSERIKLGYLVPIDVVDRLRVNEYKHHEGIVYEVNPKFSRLKLFLHRYRWIALRNPAYYFKFVVMGFKCTAAPQSFEVEADIPFSDSDYFWYIGDKNGYRKGWYFTTFEVDGEEYHELYAVIPYSPGGEYGLRARVGYKVRNPARMKEGKQYQFETSFTPFKKLGG